MIAQRQAGPRWTVAQYLELERFSPVKHEYIDSYVYAMAGGSAAHGLISANVIALLHPRLRGGPCRVFTSDVKVQLSPTRYVYPDASVTCDARDRANDKVDYISYPRLVVEVLSESTAEYDRTGKFDLYEGVAALEEYVLVDTRQMAVEVRSRQADGSWNRRVYVGGAEVVLDCLRLTVPLALFYEDVDFSGVAVEGSE